MAATRNSQIPFSQDINMELTGLLASTVLTFASFGAYAGESHMEQALKYAEAAVKADDSKVIAEHVETAKTHAKAAEEAVTHLKAAQ
jgi:Small metal-binding protein